MANIEKRKLKNGKTNYRVKIRIKNSPSVSATFEKYSDAKNWAEDTKVAIKNGKYFKAQETHTLAKAIDRYIKDVMPLKPKSAKDQTKYLNYWKTCLGNCLLNNITPAMLAKERDSLLEGNLKPRSGATVNAYFAPLSHLFSIAVREWLWLEESPLRKVTRPKIAKSRARFLSNDERTRLLAECKVSRNQHLYTIVVIALSTGARYSEILGMKWANVDLNRGTILLNTTKNGEQRLLTLAGHALDLMRAKLEQRNEGHELVFHDKNGKYLDIRPAFRCALKRADFTDFRFHDLRHSAASYLAMNGASLLEIAKVLGHKTLAMAQRYAHLSNEHTNKVVARMNNEIFGNS